MDFTHQLVELYKIFVSSGVSVRLNLWSSGKEQFFSFSKTKGSQSPTTKRNQRRRRKIKREASNLKEPPTIEVFLKDRPPKASCAEVTHRTDAGSIKSETRFITSSKSGTFGTVFLGSGAGSLDSRTSHTSSKFLKADSSTELWILFSLVLKRQK